MMGEPYTSYIKQVDRALDLPRWKKKALLKGFQMELEERFSETPSKETLLAQIGQPAEIANALLESIDSEEHKQYFTVRLRRFRCILAVFALLLALVVGMLIYLDATEIKRAEVIIVEDPVPTLYSEDMSDN